MTQAVKTAPYFRLKVVAGDTGLTDKKGSVGALTGTATQTLTDRGSGELAMRVTGGQLSATLPTVNIDHGTSLAGMTWAMDIQVENYGNLDYNLLIALGSVGITAAQHDNGPGISLRQYGDGKLNFIKDDGTSSAGPLNKGTVKQTLVCRLTSNQSGGFWRIDTWLGGSGRTGTGADYVGTLTSYGNDALSVLTLNANNTGGSAVSYNIRDLAIWNGELTDADCAAVADGLRGVVDAAPVVSTVNEIGANASQGSTSSTGTATVAPAGSSGATAKTKPLAPFGGAAQIGVTVQNVVIMKLDRSIVLSLANQVTDGTGCLSVSNAALVAGTVYLVSYWNADGSLRGIAKVTAV